VDFCCQRDVQDQLRFCPIQTTLGQDLLTKYSMPTDVSTAVLLDQHTDQTYKDSESVLRLFPYLGFPYSWMGPILLGTIPGFLRDFGYRMFARNRGAIWKGFKACTGIGEIRMYEHQNKIIGLPDDPKQIDPGWGFITSTPEAKSTASTTKKEN